MNDYVNRVNSILWISNVEMYKHFKIKIVVLKTAVLQNAKNNEEENV
jgi:hypothetical protein